MRKSSQHRVEADSMGEVAVPKNAMYGASTQRAVENFPISEFKMPLEFIRALALIKLSAVRVNFKEGLLPIRKTIAISRALQEVIDGKWDDQFVVDVFQTGSGTSTNMNLNEVVARRARFLMRKDLDDRDALHPNDDVNLSQSSNDVIPSALHLSALILIRESLLPALSHLEESLSSKARQFASVVKSGRTHRQDATPITLGQEFSGYAAQIREARKQIHATAKRLRFLAVGGTAVGTGVNAPIGFGANVCANLSEELGHKIMETDNHFRAQSSIDDVVAVSGALKLLSVSLLKICGDLRWMVSGPSSGLSEISIPAVQPGSSIMPGKVNPVILESAEQVAVYVIGSDSAITVAGQSGNFELNVMLPVVAFNLIASVKVLAATAENLKTRCIDGIEADEGVSKSVEYNSSLATALVPLIGYDEASRIAKVASANGETVLEVALRETKLSRPELAEILDPLSMTRPKKVVPLRKKRQKKNGASRGLKVGDRVEILGYKTEISWGDRKPQKYGFVVGIDGGYIYVRPRWWPEGEYLERYTSEIKRV